MAPSSDQYSYTAASGVKPETGRHWLRITKVRKTYPVSAWVDAETGKHKLRVARTDHRPETRPAEEVAVTSTVRVDANGFTRYGEEEHDVPTAVTQEQDAPAVKQKKGDSFLARARLHFSQMEADATSTVKKERADSPVASQEDDLVAIQMEEDDSIAIKLEDIPVAITSKPETEMENEFVAIKVLA